MLKYKLNFLKKLKNLPWEKSYIKIMGNSKLLFIDKRYFLYITVKK